MKKPKPNWPIRLKLKGVVTKGCANWGVEQSSGSLRVPCKETQETLRVPEPYGKRP